MQTCNEIQCKQHREYELSEQTVDESWIAVFFLNKSLNVLKSIFQVCAS